jgi:hypothetical protein
VTLFTCILYTETQDTGQEPKPYKIACFNLSKSWSRLLNIENHPIFLSPLQRLCYRVIAHTFLYFGNAKKSFALALNKSELHGYKWKHKVRTFRVFLKDKSLPRKQRKNFQYNQSPVSFMRFGRNVVAHLKDNFNQNVSSLIKGFMFWLYGFIYLFYLLYPGDIYKQVGSEKLSAKDVEEELSRYWPDFMPILHQVLVEHGHLMVVHDAYVTSYIKLNLFLLACQPIDQVG